MLLSRYKTNQANEAARTTQTVNGERCEGINSCYHNDYYPYTSRLTN